MAKKVKESKPFSIRMDKSIFDRMERFCEESVHGLTTQGCVVFFAFDMFK